MIEKIETSAEQLLEKLGALRVPVPVEDLAALLSIRISRAPSADFSGLLLRKDGHALIGVNSSEAPVRQRFTIAHELGHFVLHPQKDTFVDFRNGNKDSATDLRREREADMFAAALLMPRRVLAKDFRRAAKNGVSNEVTSALAKQYAVSNDAMRIRLMNLSAVIGQL
jgi:Zn-dependent peptidase ImmA (M78 family)